MVKNAVYLADPDADNEEKQGRVGILNIGWSVAMHAAKTSNKAGAEFIGKNYCVTNYTEQKEQLSNMMICNSSSEIKRWVVKED